MRTDSTAAAPPRPRTGVVLAVLAVLAVAVVTAPPATALDAAWSVAPSDNEHGESRPNFGYRLEPGATIEDALDVVNTGDVELTLAVAAADGYTTPQGVLDLLPLSQIQSGVGMWVVPAVSEITLAPGESTEVPFTLAVPAGAAPGDHTGGLVTVRTSSGGGTVQLEQRLGSRIHVRVPGDQVVALSADELAVSQPAQLNPVAGGTATVRYAVRNEGSVRTVFTERVTVSGPGGLGSVMATATVAEILPGSEIVRVVEIPGAWSVGYTDVSVELVPQAVDGELASPIRLDGGAWAVPWTLVAVLVLVIGAAVVIGVLRGRSEPTSIRTEPVP
ncbi:WxL protein peptidoglycan domain-containing protein [Pseudactinotalea suaedae]|uniref:WxL protein peptidoglycan domain-containing protein n=1 Tax=Pseudactinotalea suaedae TaxID=1524924 RepID=UPI0012E0D83C|nr:DUF916 domain-containing protein [Pseudactinotalea suaedae]